MIRFTVITITYNAEKVLGRTLQSVLHQTYEGVEHLVVDGASKDGTLALAEAYKQASDASDGGHMFLNAGDFFPQSDTLEQIVRRCRLMELPSDALPGVLYGNTDIVDGEGRYLHPRRLQPPAQLSWRSFLHGMLVCHQAFYARTDIAKNLQYDTKYKYSADVDWCIRVMRETERMGLTLCNINMVVANYTEEGATTRHHRESLRERYRVMASHYGQFSTFLMHCWFVVRKSIL